MVDVATEQGNLEAFKTNYCGLETRLLWVGFPPYSVCFMASSPQVLHLGSSIPVLELYMVSAGDTAQPSLGETSLGDKQMPL